MSQAGPEETGPEASFDRLMEVFRREVENSSGGFISQHQGAFSKLSFQRDVREELIPPESPEDNYRARITVETKSTYTYRSPLGNGEEEGSAPEPERNGMQEDDLLIDPIAADLPEIDLGDAPGEPRGERKGISKPVMSDRPGEDTEHFDLEYLNDRWVLQTELNPDTQSFFQVTFEYALARQ